MRNTYEIILDCGKRKLEGKITVVGKVNLMRQLHGLKESKQAVDRVLIRENGSLAYDVTDSYRRYFYAEQKITKLSLAEQWGEKAKSARRK